MKLIYITALLFLISSCDDFSLENQGFELEALPESVSFNAEGDTWDASTENAEGDTATLSIEAPNGTLENITVTYTLGGSATFGVDYTINGATANGGSVTIVPDESTSAVNDFDNVDIDIILFKDTDADDDETIIVTLTSATKSSGKTIAVGRGGASPDAGGPPFGSEATITIDEVPFITLSRTDTSIVESAEDSLAFSVKLLYVIETPISFDLVVSGSLAEMTNYTLFGNATGAGLSIAAGGTSADFAIKFLDNGIKTTSTTGIDSVMFTLANALIEGKEVSKGEAFKVKVTDDVKKYGLPTDSVDISETGVYEYIVTLSDTLSSAESPAFAEVTIPYSVNSASTAVSGTDYMDVSTVPGTLTIAKGDTNATIKIEVIRVNENTSRILTLDLAQQTSTDLEILGVGDNSSITLTITK